MKSLYDQLMRIDERYAVGFSTNGTRVEITETSRRRSDGESTVSYRGADTGALLSVRRRGVERAAFTTLWATLYAEHSTPVLSDVVVFDARLDIDSPATIHGITGGYTDGKAGFPFPPNPLRRWEQSIEPGEPFELDSGRAGKSSSENVPIWLVQLDGRGLWLGPEWSGCRHLRILREAGALRIRIGLPTLSFRMNQGETVELPPVSVGTYEGDLYDGFNTLRRVIYESFTPTIHGEKPEPALVFQGLGGQDREHDEIGLRREADVAAKIGLEGLVFNGGRMTDGLHRLIVSMPLVDLGRGEGEAWFF
jgi:hypothetical protein